MVLGMEATHRLITLGPASAMSTVAYSANTLTESVFFGGGGVAWGFVGFISKKLWPATTLKCQ